MFCGIPNRVPDGTFSSIVCRSWEVLLGDKIKDDWLQVLGVIASSSVDTGLKLPDDAMFSDVCW